MDLIMFPTPRGKNHLIFIKALRKCKATMVLLSTGSPAQFSIVTLACPSLTRGSLFNSMILSRDMRGENLRKVSPRAEKRNCASFSS